jgi:acetyltransferase-like isoleucine patch superfamily enzyme
MKINKKNMSINKHTNFFLKSIAQMLLFTIITLVVFSIGLVPAVVWIIFIFQLMMPFSTIFHFILLPFITIFSLWILFVSEIFISGAIVRLFNIKYAEGVYDYSVRNNMTFKWMLICQLYTPIRKILEIIPMGYVKTAYLKLLGMKIGKNSLIGGVIKDPCVTEIGNNVTIGEYAVLYAHIQNSAKGTIAIKKIKIGNNCVIGAGAIIMPGVVMEDNAILAAGGIVTKNRVLRKNKIYGGNPAGEIPITIKTKNKEKSK